jgi:hypothetical protein
MIKKYLKKLLESVNSTHASDKFDYEEPEGEGEEDKESDNQDDNKYGGNYGQNQSSRHGGGVSEHYSYKKEEKTSKKLSEKCKFCSNKITSK